MISKDSKRLQGLQKSPKNSRAKNIFTQRACISSKINISSSSIRIKELEAPLMLGRLKKHINPHSQFNMTQIKGAKQKCKEGPDHPTLKEQEREIEVLFYVCRRTYTEIELGRGGELIVRKPSEIAFL